MEKGYQFPNMTALLAAGVDLYLRDSNDKWHFTNGSLDFGDTINVCFENILPTTAILEYRLYLPTYRSVSQLFIGTPENTTFEFYRANDTQKPIVVYGTSILQGASASRPGLIWSSILGRKLNKEVINLGFSGNGQLELPLLDLMAEINACVFVQDCLPNLHDNRKFSDDEIEKRLVTVVKTIHAVHPSTPIVLTEHSSGIPGVSIDTTDCNKYIHVNEVLRMTFKKLTKEGARHIYLLSANQIGFDCEGTIDGTLTWFTFGLHLLRVS